MNDNRKTDWQNISIAMLVKNFSCRGGLELYTHKLTEGLLEQGLSVTVICEEVQTELKHERLKIVPVAKLQKKSSKAKQIKHYFNVFSQAIKEHGPFDIVHSQHIGAEPIDVVTFHNHTVARANQVGQAFEILLNKLKMILRSDYKLRNQMDEMLFKKSRVRLFPSILCKEDFIDYFKVDQASNYASLMVAYPGWQLDSAPEGRTADDNNSLPDPDEKNRTIVFVGRGYRKKGLDILLAACRTLKKENYSFKLLIAGLTEKIFTRWLLRLNGLDKNVHFLGFCKDMSKVYQAGSILALPSRLEPFGMVVLQAMSYGLVPVVSRVSGSTELLTNEQNCILINNHLDEKELAAKLAFLLDNPKTLKDLSHTAQQKAQSITWQSTVEVTLEAYKQVFQTKYVV